MSRTNISTSPNQPTVTGDNLTWVAVNSVVYDTTSTSRKRITLFRALGASPTAGALTIDFGGQTQTDTIWAVDQVSGVNTSGTNGSGAVVQSAINNIAGGGTLTVTLGAFSSASNITYGALTEDSTTDGLHPTAGTGFTALTSTNSLPGGGSPQEYMTEWEAANNTSVAVNFTADASSVAGGIAVEVAAAPVVASSGHALVYVKGEKGYITKGISYVK